MKPAPPVTSALIGRARSPGHGEGGGGPEAREEGGTHHGDSVAIDLPGEGACARLSGWAPR